MIRRRALAVAGLMAVLIGTREARGVEEQAAPSPAEEKIVLREIEAAKILLRGAEPRGAHDRLLRGKRALQKIKESQSLPPQRIKELTEEISALDAEITKSVARDPGGLALEGVKLEGIVVGSGRSAAIINGRVVRIGETVPGGHKLIKVERDRITLLSGDKEVVVALRDAAEPGKVPIPGKPVGAADIEVQAIIVGGDHRRAVVNGRAVSEGQEVAPGVKVEKIERHAVTFDVNGEKVVKQR